LADTVAGLNQEHQRDDPLATSTASRWLVRVDLFRKFVDVRELALGTDLRRALALGIERLSHDDWDIKGVSFQWHFC